jgi:hypothetical protein
MGKAKLQKRETIIRRKLPARGQQYGLTSSHVQFITLLIFDLKVRCGRQHSIDGVYSEEVAVLLINSRYIANVLAFRLPRLLPTDLVNCNCRQCNGPKILRRIRRSIHLLQRSLIFHRRLWRLGLDEAEGQTTEAERNGIARLATVKKHLAEIGYDMEWPVPATKGNGFELHPRRG